MSKAFFFVVFTIATVLLSGGDAVADALARLQQSTWSEIRHPDGSCENPSTFHLSDDGTRLLVSLQEPIRIRGTLRRDASYQILAQGPQNLDLFLEQETYRDADGNLVWWRLIFVSEDEFVWMRSDWSWGQFTPPRYRCPLMG